MFQPQNNYLFIKLENTPTRGTSLSVPMWDGHMSFGTIVAGDPELEGKGVLFDNRGLSSVWIKNIKHTFIKLTEIISLVEL